jgi:hypothetical protein
MHKEVVMQATWEIRQRRSGGRELTGERGLVSGGGREEKRAAAADVSF